MSFRLIAQRSDPRAFSDHHWVADYLFQVGQQATRVEQTPEHASSAPKWISPLNHILNLSGAANAENKIIMQRHLRNLQQFGKIFCAAARLGIISTSVLTSVVPGSIILGLSGQTTYLTG